MPEKIRIAIVGYGNIGRGVLRAVKRNQELYGDMEVAGIVSRRAEAVIDELRKDEGLPTLIMPIIPFDDFFKHPDGFEADVAVLCGGSKQDLPEQGPRFARFFNTVDSFDTHKDIPDYFARMNNISMLNGSTAVISAGWDPGTFSLERVLGSAFIPGTNPRGFYGLGEQGGLSMGHSDALRKIPGVRDARQYTHVIPEAMEVLRADGSRVLSPGDRQWRECFIVLENNTPEERARVEQATRTMKGYFDEYRTTVAFTDNEGIRKLDAERGMLHDGVVITSGKTASGTALIEYRNEWRSNPEGTAGILVACARACYRLNNEGRKGAFTMLDIPPAYYSPKSQAELLKDFM